MPVTNIICDGSSIVLTASGGDKYQWKLNGANIPGAIDSSYAAKVAGIYTVTLINRANCSALATGNIALTLISKPTVAFSYVNNCVNLPVSFTNTSDVSKSGTVTYAWIFGNGNRSTLVKPVDQIYPTVGNYNIKLVVTPTSCPILYDSLIKVINIVAPPLGTRYPSMNVLKNVATTLQARNIGTTYGWNPVLGLSNAAISSPIFNFNVGADYQINIVNAAGCKIVDSLLIRVFEKYSVFTPKAFSPDGNGVNDFLRPILVGIKDVKSFRVYSRWGNLLFQTKDISIGWDGTYNGQLMPTDSYTWVFEGIDLDNKPVISSGKSTLIR
jgi:gliding motility-associated-like protein